MRSSADDPVARAITAGVQAVSDAVAALTTRAPLVVIDGRSGAGKTSLAERLAACWPFGAAAQLVALDTVYPGWDGMAAGIETALRDIVIPFSRGATARWRLWDWVASAPGGEATAMPDRGLIIEGCGVLTPQIAECAHVRVWVHSPDAARKTRALHRDGDTFRPHWDRWAAQEEDHIARHNPRQLADVVVRVP